MTGFPGVLLADLGGIGDDLSVLSITNGFFLMVFDLIDLLTILLFLTLNYFTCFMSWTFFIFCTACLEADLVKPIF